MWADCRSRFGAAGPWLFGAFSPADAMFAPVALRFVTYGVALDATGRAYVDAVAAHPAVQEWIAAARTESEVIAGSEVGDPNLTPDPTRRRDTYPPLGEGQRGDWT